MEREAYTPEQLHALQGNSNVLRCSPKSITYTAAFKQSALKAYYEQGQGPQEIFRTAGFDLGVIGRDTPKSCLVRWRKIYQAQGETGLQAEMRGRGGGRKRKVAEPDDPQYLKAKIMYLEAENAFLRKLKTKPKL